MHLASVSEIAANLLPSKSSFSPLPNVFYPSQTKFQFFIQTFLLSANDFSLDQSKILSFGKVLKSVTYEAFTGKRSLSRPNAQSPLFH